LPAPAIKRAAHAGCRDRRALLRAELKSDFKPPRSGPDERAGNVDLEQRSEASVEFNPVTSFRGVDKMTVRIFAMVPATILALGAATALAQPSANPFAQFGRTNLIDHSTSLWPYEETGAIVANTAFVSDGCTPSYLPNQQ
jgi:hypothetical protein